MRATFGQGRRAVGVVFCLVLLAAVVFPLSSAGVTADKHGTKDFWHEVADPKRGNGRKADVKAERLRALALDRAALETALGPAPQEDTTAALEAPLVVSLPAPDGGFQRFAL